MEKINVHPMELAVQHIAIWSACICGGRNGCWSADDTDGIRLFEHGCQPFELGIEFGTIFQAIFLIKILGSECGKYNHFSR
jgi:hypothetical protein